MGLFDIFKNKNNVAIKKDGFDFSYTSAEYNEIRTKKYTLGTIQQYLKILDDSKKLVNTTKNPDVFFNRYLIIIAIVNELIFIEKKINFKGTLPSQIKGELIQKEVYTVNDFINRFYEETNFQISKLKTATAKQKRIEIFCHGLDNYVQYLTEASKTKYNKLRSSFK